MKFLFKSCEYEFYDSGLAINLPLGQDSVVRYEIGWESGRGAEVYWLWTDGTASLADDKIQEDYRAYVAGLIVGASGSS